MAPGFTWPQGWVGGDGIGSTEQAVADFNGDGKADIGVYNVSNGNWYVGLSTGTTLGSVTPVVAGTPPAARSNAPATSTVTATRHLYFSSPTPCGAGGQADVPVAVADVVDADVGFAVAVEVSHGLLGGADAVAADPALGPGETGAIRGRTNQLPEAAKNMTTSSLPSPVMSAKKSLDGLAQVSVV